MNERSVNAWLLAMVMRYQPADFLRLSLQLVFGVFFVFFFENQLRNKLGCKWFLFCCHSLKMGLLILKIFLILFRLKWILFELIYGVVWTIFGFRVQEFGADLCYCLSIFCFCFKGSKFWRGPGLIFLGPNF